MLLRALLGFCLLWAGVTGQAATITWGAATTIATTNDAYLGGTTKYAYVWTTSGQSFDNGEVSFTPTTTTNGTTADGNLTVAGFTSRGATTFSSFSTPFLNLQANYKNDLSGAAFETAGAICTLTLNNLSVGTNYALQVWIGDPRGSAGNTNRYATIASGANSVDLLYNTTEVAGGLGQYVVGTFTADATSQSFTIQGKVISGQTGTANSQINCFQLRDLSPVPAATPAFNPPTGPTYFGAQNIIVSSEIASTVYYTIDGSTPSTNSSPHGTPGSGFALASIPAGATTTVKAVATADAKFKTLSAEADAIYTTSASAIATWTTPGGGSWTNSVNWANGVIAFGPNATADFSTVSLTGPAIVTLDAGRTNGSMWFDDQSQNNNSWTLNNSPLTLWDTSGSPVISNNVQVTLNPSTLQGWQGFTKTGPGSLSVLSPTPISGNVFVENGRLQMGSGSTLAGVSLHLGTTNSGTSTTTLRFGPAFSSGASIASMPIFINSAAPSSTAILDGHPGSSAIGNITAAITLQGGRSVLFTNSGPLSYRVSKPLSGTTMSISGNGDVVISTTTYANRVRLNNTNAFTGNLRIINGGVQITDYAGAGTNKNVIPDTADVFMSANTTMGFSGDEIFGALNGVATAVIGGNFTNNNKTFSVTIGANNNSGTFDGTIQLADLDNPATNNLPLSITKIGTGTQSFNGISMSTAPSYVGGGSLFINGSYAASAITVSNNATLGGVGTLAGAASVQAGGTLAPGTNNAVGTLTINNNLTLAGNLFIKVDKSQPVQSNDLVTVTGALNNSGTGTVTITNLNASPSFAFAVGDKFTLFSQPLSGGNAMTFSPASPGPGLAWVNNLALDGSIGVIQSVGLNPTSITFSVSGSTLTLSWPADHLGWHLEMQTNTLAAGLKSTGWVVIPGTDLVTQANFPIGKTNPTMFYRLTYP
jgi:hypothetical protein